MSPRSNLRIALITSSFLIIGTGAYFALSGASWGLLIAAAGVADLLTIPFVIRMIERGQAAESGGPGSQSDGAVDPVEAAADDPSYNPYARED